MWAINSPALADFGDKTWRPSPVHDSEIKTVEVQRLCARMQSNRVGRYFEDLVSFYLTQIRGFELVAERKQLIHEGRTLGELDFLFRDSNGSLVHLETAVKFYLRLKSGTINHSQLIGPDPSDTFERKIDHMLGHQLSLGKSVNERIDRSLAVMKGRIYDHVKATSKTAGISHLAANHLRGVWLHASEWDADLFPNMLGVHLLSKPNWLAPVLSGPSITLDAFDGILQNHFGQSTRPIHGCFDQDSSLVFFVVADRWPT